MYHSSPYPSRQTAAASCTVSATRIRQTSSCLWTPFLFRRGNAEALPKHVSVIRCCNDDFIRLALHNLQQSPVLELVNHVIVYNIRYRPQCPRLQLARVSCWLMDRIKTGLLKFPVFCSHLHSMLQTPFLFFMLHFDLSELRRFKGFRQHTHLQLLPTALSEYPTQLEMDGKPTTSVTYYPTSQTNSKLFGMNEQKRGIKTPHQMLCLSFAYIVGHFKWQTPPRPTESSTKTLFISTNGQ